jgi:hypothetical protein
MPSPAPKTDRDLIERAKVEAEAFGTLFDPRSSVSSAC